MICRKGFRFNFVNFSSHSKVNSVICDFDHYSLLISIFIFVGQWRQVVNWLFAWECRGPYVWLWYSILNWICYATQVFIFNKLLDHLLGLWLLDKSKSWHSSSSCSDLITIKVRNSFQNGCCVIAGGTHWLPVPTISYFCDGSLLNNRNSLNS